MTDQRQQWEIALDKLTLPDGLRPIWMFELKNDVLAHIRQLENRVARLEYLSGELFEQTYDNSYLDDLYGLIIDECPAQSLAEMQIYFMELANNYVVHKINVNSLHKADALHVLHEYIQKLRNSIEGE